MGLRLGIGKEKLQSTRGQAAGDRAGDVGSEGEGECWSIAVQPPPFPRAVVRGAIHLLRPPGLEGSCPLSGKGTLPIPIPSTFARPP